MKTVYLPFLSQPIKFIQSPYINTYRFYRNRSGLHLKPYDTDTISTVDRPQRLPKTLQQLQPNDFPFGCKRFLTLRQTGKRTKEKRMTLPSPSFKEFFQKRVRILHIICVSTNYGELSSITSFTRASPFLHSERHCAQPNEL